MADTASATFTRRVYPLDAHALTEEQIAVAFAMTSRSPESFDEIAQQVSREKAADFHERWVLGYGHASVAEHAVVHLAVENISRLAADSLEDNRLASYTEKSSRYQILPPNGYHVPGELRLKSEPELDKVYRATCRRLFQAYQRCLEGCQEYLRSVRPRDAGERESAYRLRLRREATDSCRAVLPAATLTNVGVTANARVLEHAITKLLSSELAEEQDLGQELKQEARRITPTLIKYAESNTYLRLVAQHQRELAGPDSSGDVAPRTTEAQVRLAHWDPQAEAKLATALLYRASHRSYPELWERVQAMDAPARQDVIGQCLSSLGPHDAPVRELELVDYTFEFVMDYGAYREFKRHRMQTYLAQPLTVAHGYHTPVLLAEAGLRQEFQGAVVEAEAGYWQVHRFSPAVAQYLATHAHYRRVVSKLNLRECYHLFKLRISGQAHESIRDPMRQALELAQQVHPGLFIHLRLRP